MHSFVRRACVPALLATAMLAAHPARADFTLEQALSYSYASRDDRRPSAPTTIAWVVNLRGVRNIWVADGPGFRRAS